jgi:hypothetical protein
LSNNQNDRERFGLQKYKSSVGDRLVSPEPQDDEDNAGERRLSLTLNGKKGMKRSENAKGIDAAKDVKGVASLYIADTAEAEKRSALVGKWNVKTEKQKIISSPKEAMRAFKQKMQQSNVNVLDAFKKVRDASGSDDLLIDLPEFTECLKNTGVHVRPEVASMLFSQFDPDGSGEIDYTEFATKIRSAVTPRLGASLENTKEASKPRTLAELKAKRRKMMLAADTGAIDIDGDGLIDEYEIQLAKYLKDVKGKDLDGDGIVDEFEKLSAQRQKGKELMVGHLREKYRGRLHEFGKHFRGRSDDDICSAMMRSKNFGYAMKTMTAKAHMVDLKSSLTMKNVLAPRSQPESMSRWRNEFFGRPSQKRAAHRQRVLIQARARALERSKRSSPYEKFMRQHLGYYKMATSGFHCRGRGK